MQTLEILNKKQIKEISKLIELQWDASFDFHKYAVFYSVKDKIFLINSEVTQINFDELRVNTLGTYFGEKAKGEIRLSIEGSQMVGPSAKKNVLELSDSEADSWMQGKDFDVDSDLSGFVIIKNNDDFLGCGRVSGQKVFNYVPKERREKLEN
ncbi:MAG: hypothetical protein KKF44_03200 [Nanoarchaeota archaeon]|nr:hypothetical protein [Nanoarchaeota archaeon]